MRKITPQILLYLILLPSCVFDRKEYVIQVGESIRHGKFEYSVPRYMVTRFLKHGNDTLHARGMFYLVTFRVQNNAKHASHFWDNSIAYITDEKAGTFGNEPSVQQFYNNGLPFGLREKYITHAGSSDSTVLAFDLPFNVTKPFLKVKGRFLLSDLNDAGEFRRVRIRLN